MKTLKLKNSWLDILIKILDGNLPFTRSRKRKLFVDILIQKIKDRENGRMALIEKFGKKDDKGKLLLDDDKYQLEKPLEFSEEFQTLYNEEIVIDIPPSIQESIVVVKEIVNNTDINVSNNEVEMIEEIIKSFDDIKE